MTFKIKVEPETQKDIENGINWNNNFNLTLEKNFIQRLRKHSIL